MHLCQSSRATKMGLEVMNQKMLLAITETVLGLVLLNISFNSLTKSVIRRWREGFLINFAIGVIVMLYGLLSMFVQMPQAFNNVIFFAAIAGMTFSTFLISRMHGLKV